VARAKPDSPRRVREAVRDAIVEVRPAHVVFSPQALDRAYQLLVAADPQRKSDSICGRLSTGFPVRGEDYQDAPDED